VPILMAYCTSFTEQTYKMIFAKFKELLTNCGVSIDEILFISDEESALANAFESVFAEFCLVNSKGVMINAMIKYS